MPLPAGGWAEDAAQRALVARRLRRTCESLFVQGIDRWELIIGVSSAQKSLVTQWLKNWKTQWMQGRVLDLATDGPNILSDGEKREFQIRLQSFHLVTCPAVANPDSHVSTLHLKKLVHAAQGDWVGFAFAGDRFAPHFVYECLMRIVQRPAVEMVYFDDDVLKVRATAKNAKNAKNADSTNDDDSSDISETYARIKPQFKPDFSPDFLISNNYIGLSFITKTDHVHSLVAGKWQQSLNFPMQLVLGLSQAICAKAPMIAKEDKHRVASSLNRLPAWHDQYPIQHIGQVLRHRDLSKFSGSDGNNISNSNRNSDHPKGKETNRNKHTFGSAASQAWLHETSKAALADGKRVAASLKLGFGSDSCSMLPKVSIIIPTKDQFGILKVCLESLLDKTDYPNYEVVVVDNQTTQASALRYLRALPTRDLRVSVMRYDQPFNYSDINNQAVARCDGEVLLFLNNDVEVLDGNWLREMVRHAVRHEVGCVGAKLLYPDRTIQHAGVALGMHGVADHMYRGMEDCRESDPYGYLHCVRNPAAVTGAVMAVKRAVFEAVGGFDAIKLPVAFNDVDLCLKAEMAGFRTVWTPEACLIHHESKTRAPRKVMTKKDGQASKLSPTVRSKTSKKHIREEHDSVVSSSIVVKAQSHATERSEIRHMHKSWGKLLKSKFEVLGQRHETLRFL